MKFFNSLHFFGSDSSINPSLLKQSVSKSNLKTQDNSKWISIFNALDLDKNGTIDNNELQTMYDEMSIWARFDNVKCDINLSEMEEYIKSLKDSDDKSLVEKGITPLDIYNFINENLSIKKLHIPSHLRLLNMLSKNEDLNIDITTVFTKEQYEQVEKLLSEYTNKYNLMNKSTDNQSISDMQTVVNLFYDEYGKSLVSTSREVLLTGNITEEASYKYSYVRDGHGSIKSGAEWLSQKEKIKEVDFANCGECQDMVLDILEKNYKGQYEYSAINILCKVKEPKFLGYKTHCAVLVKDSSGEEYVIDMWLNPNDGGIFKKTEWEKLVSEIYLTNEYKIETNHDFVTAINS